jgi:serine-aspartate repeat-containing protein C/D/E
MKKIISFAIAMFLTTTSYASHNHHSAYISGYPDNTFRPDNTITRAEVSKVVVSSLEIEKKDGYSFYDIQSDHWASPFVYTAKNNNYIGGYEDNSFRPEKHITRAEFSVIIYRTVENYIPQSLKENQDYNLTDIGSHWAKKEINALNHIGAIKGLSDSSFKPDEPLTRAEAVTILNRIQGRTADKSRIAAMYKQVYNDANLKDHWAYYDIIEASVNHEFFIIEDENKNQAELWTRLYF